MSLDKLPQIIRMLLPSFDVSTCCTSSDEAVEQLGDDARVLARGEPCLVLTGEQGSWPRRMVDGDPIAVDGGNV